ncbi:MAG: DUF6171 family protein [Clostridiales bacterium]|jgi:hypothetical protein|nr:DUF6171 family protein [Clostridiales bacterium]
MEDFETRECRRCLLSELSDAAYYQNVYDYIGRLSDEIKAAPEVYRRRLAACQTCGELVNGMCRLCGCFVEARAAKRSNRCPKVDPLW